MNLLLRLRIQYEHDVVAARQRTRQIAEALDFDTQQQTRLATAVSEIARNAFSYAGGGEIEFSLEGTTAPQLLLVVVSDRGPGIGNLEQILAGRYQSETGMGLGLVGAQRLMDQFRVTTEPGLGTKVVLGKLLPKRAPLITPRTLPALLARLEKQNPRDLLAEFREQNQELLRTLDELRRRQEELSSLNRELEDTNRGVVALYAELDEKADSLRKADEVKSRFLSNMSHEFRTPLNSVIALSRLLLDRTDGELTGEQEIQVTFIRKAAESLSELVNDLLDLAKVEAGKTEVRPVEFEVVSLFGALRGMLRPLLVSSVLNLVFEEPAGIPPLYSDEGKVSQILRNFISNALKFTEAGEVRVSAEYDADAQTVTFRVSDTGIGIGPEHRETIFQEFTQIDSALQRKLRGTGLGLPLSRRLGELLGGSVSVESEPGVGSVFTLRLPVSYSVREEDMAPLPPAEDADGRATILLIEDHYETRLAYEKYLRSTGWRLVGARSVREAESALRHVQPLAIILDISLNGDPAWDFLARTKNEPSTRTIPILVATSVDDRLKALALGADEYLAKPVSGQTLREMLKKLINAQNRTVMIVDDEEVSRYLARQLFSGPVRFVEAKDGRQALQMARAEKPDLVLMDLMMPEMNGFDAVEAMRHDEELRRVPVVVTTSRTLTPGERSFLSERTLAILPKANLMDSEETGKLAGLLREAGLDALAVGIRRAGS